MTAFRVKNVLYVAKSTDIDENDKISNVGVIGAKVYTTDDGKWYIVDESLVLQPYVQPALETV